MYMKLLAVPVTALSCCTKCAAVGMVDLAVHEDEEVDDHDDGQHRKREFQEGRNFGFLALGDPAAGVFFQFRFGFVGHQGLRGALAPLVGRFTSSSSMRYFGSSLFLPR